MFFETVGSVLSSCLARFSETESVPVGQLDAGVAQKIVAISDAHFNPALDIDYRDFLARLAYIYVHVGANATLFFWALRDVQVVGDVVAGAGGGRLSICAFGGGPGTELLGLVKHLRGKASLPRRIDFRVLDRAHHWSDSWEAMARESEARLARENPGAAGVVIAPMFTPVDVTDPEEFAPYATAFGEVDLFVFNYILSENKSRLGEIDKVLALLGRRAKPGAVFVFIDRREHGLDLDTQVNGWCASAGLTVVHSGPMPARNVDSEDQVDPHLGDFPRRFRPPGSSRNRLPRLKFFKDTVYGRYATAFVLVARK